MLVKTLLGEICPLEGKYRDYITDAEAGVEVADTSYYRRLLDEGSLILAVAPVAAKPVKIKEGSANE
ncbi:MAG: hypothetical protein HXX17_15690 [Geobacteraceae bacterium]|nr:hypothetical protein [Geobacteraceae bacterium]